MKGAIFGAVGVCGVGAVALGGGGGPDDFIGVLKKPPSAVYAAFSELGPAGEQNMQLPAEAGWPRKITQRVVKVPNEQVKLELLVDDQPLVTAEVQLSPEGEGTRLAAELDFNDALVRELMKEAGAPPVPTFAFQDFLIDQVFAQAMGEMVEMIETGKPLLPLADTHARWGGGEDGGSRPGTFSYQSEPAWQHRQAGRPQLHARPAIDPDAGRLDVSR